MHPHEPLVAITNTQEFAIFNTASYSTNKILKKIWSINSDKADQYNTSKTILSPLDCTLITCGQKKGIVLYDYYNNTAQQFPVLLPQAKLTCFSKCPHNETVFICNSTTGDAALIHPHDRTHPVTDIFSTEPYDTVTHMALSPNGKWIVFDDFNHGCFFINRASDNKKPVPILDADGNQIQSYSMVFHPDSILALINFYFDDNHTIGTPCHDTLYYYSLQDQKTIHTHKIERQYDGKARQIAGTCLEFSPDGKKIIVALKNTCVVFDVLAETINSPLPANGGKLEKVTIVNSSPSNTQPPTPPQQQSSYYNWCAII